MGSLAEIDNVEGLEERLSRPTPEGIASLHRLDGDLVVLGAGGKMGPTLARMAARGLAETGSSHRVIGVSRFSEPEVRNRLEARGVTTISCDLLDGDAVARLPDAPNILFLAGRKFGSTGAESLTWAMNGFLPGRVMERYRGSRFVIFSSGNLYPLVPISSGGATEETLPEPVGEYAQSVLARERICEHFSRVHASPALFFRLNYAVEFRYGVLLDIARRVWTGEPIQLSMGCLNCIWQGDANAIALRSLEIASSPPRRLNVTGPETVSVRWLASRFGELLDRAPVLAGEEASTATLSNAAQCHGQFGYPTTPLDSIIEGVARWVATGKPTLEKPTHFETRDGRY